MSLEKQKVIDQIEVVESGVVQIRTIIKIIEDGKIISSSLHRHVVAPGGDYSGEDDRVQAICAATHTADVIAAYQAATAARGV
jgi:hypothetical protein